MLTELPEHETNNYYTAGPGSLVTASLAAAIMIAAAICFMPPLSPKKELGLCFSVSTGLIPHLIECGINVVLVTLSIIMAFAINKKHSFVKSTETLLPTAMTVLLASNPVNTSYLGTPVIMLLVNLVCLDIMMKAYNSQNATTSMFAIATYLSLGSMVQYAFLPLMIVYPLMAIIDKILRFKEIVAYVIGLIAPYWVAIGLGLVSFSDFQMPHFLESLPVVDGNYLLMVFISLGTLALIELMMSLNNAMLIYAGNIKVRRFNNMINLLGFSCGLLMLADFDNFGAYASSFCFAGSVQIANFFALRRIPQSHIWFWGILSLFMAFFLFMLIESLIA